MNAITMVQLKPENQGKWSEGHLEYFDSLTIVTGKGDGIFDPKDNKHCELVKKMLSELEYGKILRSPVIDFNMTNQDNEKLIWPNTNGVTASIAYKVNPKDDIAKYEVAYINEANGILEPIRITDEKKGSSVVGTNVHVTINAPHFSKYAVVYKNKAYYNVLREQVKKLDFKLATSSSKGKIRLKWNDKYSNLVDGYEVFRSTRKNSGYGNKPLFKISNEEKNTYINTKNLKKSTKYYYKIRAYQYIDGKKVYSNWSKKGYRTAL